MMINVFLLGAGAPLQVRSLLMAYNVCLETLFKNKNACSPLREFLN
jgi:hypothetical protein